MTLSVAAHAIEVDAGSRHSRELSGGNSGGIGRRAEPESIENSGYGQPALQKSKFPAYKTSEGNKADKESVRAYRVNANCKRNQHRSQPGESLNFDTKQSLNRSHKDGRGGIGTSSIRNDSSSNQYINQLAAVNQKVAVKALNSAGFGRLAGMALGSVKELADLRTSVALKLFYANLKVSENSNSEAQPNPHAAIKSSISGNGSPTAGQESARVNDNPNSNAKEAFRGIDNLTGEIRKLDFRWLIPKTDLKEGSLEFGSKQSSTNQILTNNPSDPQTIRQNWVRFAVFDQFYVKGDGGWEINQFNRLSQLQIKNSIEKSGAEPKDSAKSERSNEQTAVSTKSASVRRPASANTSRAEADSRTDKGDKSESREHIKTSDTDKHSSRMKNKSVPSHKSDSAQKIIGENVSQSKLTDSIPAGSKSGNLSASFASMIDAKSNVLNHSVLKQLPSDISRIVLSSINTETKLAGRILRLNLYPPELGSIDLRFYEVNERISVRVMMESESVYKMLSRNVDELKEALRASGVNIDKVEFGFVHRDSFNPDDYERNSGLLNGQHQLSNGSSKDLDGDGQEDSAGRAAVDQESTEGEDLYVSVNGVNWLA